MEPPLTLPTPAQGFGGPQPVHLLGVLNPTAARCGLERLSPERLRDFLLPPRQIGKTIRGTESARVVPPWLDLLHEDGATTRAPGCFLYRRSRPFDPERFGAWISNPPRALLRGKGNVWLANRPEQSFGYSCAGAVHRVFVAGRWWVDHGPSAWPTCESARRRLLERWDPRFGDRRQEIAFAGMDLEPDAICAALDGCLLSEEAALELVDAPVRSPAADESPRVGLH